MSWLKKLFGRGGERSRPEGRPADVAGVADILRRQGRPSLWLMATEESRSWLGGAPSLGEGVEWPRLRGEHMGFIGQLDLAEVRAAGGPDWLPEAGTLAFFFNEEAYDGSNPETWKVVWFAGEAVAPPPPDAPEDWFYKVPVCFVATPSYPLGERSHDIRRGLSEDDEAALEAELGVTPQTPSHRIGGYPVPIQGDDMEAECQSGLSRWSRGLRRSEASPPKEADWRLLLQVDTDDQLATNWVDSGTLYFWILEQDARAADFSRVWVTMQFS